jgi:hypothetical protein
MPPYLPHLSAEEHMRDLRREARRRRHPAAAAEIASADVVIRLATSGDLRRLAALDDAAVPAGPALVAEVGGAPAAALPLDGGRAIADPFRRTCELVALLELRATQLTRGGRGRFARLRRRSAYPLCL